jgi:hypothetical protein
MMAGKSDPVPLSKVKEILKYTKMLSLQGLMNIKEK